MPFRWLIRKLNGRRARQAPSRWAGGSAWRYGVGIAPAQKPVEATEGRSPQTGYTPGAYGRLNPQGFSGHAVHRQIEEYLRRHPGPDRPRELGEPGHSHLPGPPSPQEPRRCSLCGEDITGQDLVDHMRGHGLYTG